MAQNIYDDDGFFAAYAQLPRSVGGLDLAPEWPSLAAMLPDVRGARVVDLGCGYGWFSRWAVDSGAASVLGIDLSERMLDRARASTTSSAVEYQRQDLDELQLPAGAFDLAYSSLTLHYLTDLDRFFTIVQRALAPGGSLVLSTEHPIFTAPSEPAFTATADGRSVWPLDDYLEEGTRLTDWLAPGVVKQHRTIATTVTALVGAGFTLTHLEEWGPSTAQLAAEPAWALERDRPMFLLLAATRT